MNWTGAALSLHEARKKRWPRLALNQEFGSFSVEDAYHIQKLGLELVLAEGAAVCGYKMGLTSRAKQKDVGVSEAIRGYLLREFEIEKHAKIARERFIHPRAEPEIAVVLKTPLEGKWVTARQVEQALSFIGPAIEIVDSRYKNFQFSLPDVIADNTSASGFIVGTSNWISSLGQLGLMGVVVKKNGEVMETGAPRAVLGDPLLAVASLVRGLAEVNMRLEAGEIILTGGITASLPFESGDIIETEWAGETLSFVCQ